MSRLVHIGEAFARDSEDARSAAADEMPSKSFLIPWHPVVFVTYAKIEREIRARLPVVLEKCAPLVLMKSPQLASRVPGSALLFRTGFEHKILGIIQEERLLRHTD